MTVAVGLVGCGRWGRLILRDLVSLGAVVHVAVRDLDDRAELVALGASSVVVGCDSLPSVDGVVIATPTTVHAESIELVLPRGVPVFVEKPLTEDSRTARSIAKRAPDRVFVMDKWRYHPGVHVLRELVSSGRLGVVREINTVRVQDGMPHTDVDCTWILLPHDLSIAHEVMGSLPRPVRAIGRAVDGVLVHVDATLCIDPDVAMHVSFGIDATEAERRISVVGTEATAVLAGGWEKVVTVYPSAGRAAPQEVPAEGELPLLAELRAFVGHLGGGPPPVSSAFEGARAVEIVSQVRSLSGA
jgi:predicted dehydrogenase